MPTWRGFGDATIIFIGKFFQCVLFVLLCGAYAKAKSKPCTNPPLSLAGTMWIMWRFAHDLVEPIPFLRRYSTLSFSSRRMVNRACNCPSCVAARRACLVAEIKLSMDSACVVVVVVQLERWHLVAVVEVKVVVVEWEVMFPLAVVDLLLSVQLM